MKQRPSSVSGTESHDPAVPAAYAEFMRQGWADRPRQVEPHPIIEPARARRAKLREWLPGERLVIPAGGYKQRSNDTNYRFRPQTAHTHLCGNQTSDAVLVMDDDETILFARPRAGRDSDEFFRDRQYGELWAGRRPSLAELEASLGIPTRHIDELESYLDSPVKTRVLRGADARVDKVVDSDPVRDDELAQLLSELRLIKDDWAIDQLQGAIDLTILGFEDCVRDWDNAIKYGERWIEGTFFRRARVGGNDLGYDSIVGGGAHATTLHWIDNTGPITPGEMVLLDMGAEATSLYTADITRTLPISGRFTALQRELYEAVLQAQQAGIEAVRPGAAFRDPHHAAMRVLAHKLEDIGVLPCSAEEALDPNNRTYARWTLHGTSHMLGMDVHDCAAARNEVYTGGDLEAGMVLTVEPGLYFQADDELVPPELRGIGIRIEDDILVTDDGAANLSAALPTHPDEVEEWMGRLWQG